MDEITIIDAESKPIESEVSSESAADEKKKQSTKTARMWHRNRKGELCHLFDINHPHFLLWRQGQVPLRAEECTLPSGSKAVPGGQIHCGTCKTTKVGIPSEWIVEYV